MRDPDWIERNSFAVLKQISELITDNDYFAIGQEFAIRCLEYKEKLNGCSEILYSLIHQVGLYPYFEPDHSSVREQLAYEFHRMSDLDDGIVFHRPQSEVYEALVSGENVILSAPTSFGKSLIIDAVIATREFKNVVIVVPTIALIDETRRRLARFSGKYKLLTHSHQERAERNIFILTQERVMEREDLADIDFFVVDEFYKLDPSRGDEERSLTLNSAFHKLLRTQAQFYLLGPNIAGLTQPPTSRFRYKLFVEDYHTVAANVDYVSTDGDELAVLAQLCESLADQTLIYCRSPKRVRQVAQVLYDSKVRPEISELAEYAEWAAENYSSEWLFTKVLRNGIGLHHGQIPRSLAQLNVKLFNEHKIDILVCTSTLIEGVNTSARNVIILDHTLAQKKYDYFTFTNIKGRSGRMMRHYIGNVYLFKKEPHRSELQIDIPILDESEDISEVLLVQLEPEELTPPQRQKSESLLRKSDLSVDLIRRHASIGPDVIASFANTLEEQADYYHHKLRWSGIPDYEQVLNICEVCFEYLKYPRSYGVFTPAQLAFKIDNFRRKKDISSFIEDSIERNYEKDIQDSIENSFAFIRNHLTYNAPKYFLAVNDIQNEIFGRLGLAVGDYTLFIGQMESLYLPSPMAALEEYGLPLPLSQRIFEGRKVPDELDEAIQVLRRSDFEQTGLSSFERGVVRWVKDGI